MFLKDLIGLDHFLPNKKTWKEFVNDVRITLLEKEHDEFNNKVYVLMNKYPTIFRETWGYMVSDTQTDFYNRFYLQAGIIFFLYDHNIVKNKEIKLLRQHIDNWLFYRITKKFKCTIGHITPDRVWKLATDNKYVKCANTYYQYITELMFKITERMNETK